MTTATQRALAKAIQNAPSQVALAEPAPLTITRGTIAAVAHVENGIAQTYVQLPGSKQNVPAEVALGYGAAVGDVVDILVAPPRLIVLGPTSNIPSGPGISSSYYASLTGPGEKATPGDLTQDGGFNINGNLAVSGSGDAAIVLVATDAFGGGGSPIQIIAESYAGSGAALYLEGEGTFTGVEMYSNNRIIIHSGTSDAYLGNPIAATTGFVAAGGAILTLSGPDGVRLQTNTTDANVLVHAGSPNGFIAGSQGDLCIDIGTPGLWQCSGGTAWTAF